MNAEFIIQELLSVANPEKANFLLGFFKTGKGQYAEGDVMLGIVVPLTRDVVKKCPELPFSEIQLLLDSEYHEVRLAGLLLLVKQFKKAKGEEEKKKIFDFYLRNARKANNWDLVDVTCRDVIGLYLLDKTDRSALYRLVESDNLWEQRIAIVSTWTFIKNYQFDDTLAISIKLLNHKHDLIHKAVGWMLREVGKKDREVLVNFLNTYHAQLPRTSLRYAIEHFAPEERAYYLYHFDA
ncbi:DNA alkylation repair protein [Bacteroidia bacterium]|nr:DNA alkylation repair protein [Bacteroidia bacterium]GHV07910.1 DNA alkylation repair protein [Bacteroidia bacterium]